MTLQSKRPQHRTADKPNASAEERQAALSESKRTESYWIRTRIFDAAGTRQVAEMLLNHAVLKQSYAGYAEA